MSVVIDNAGLIWTAITTPKKPLYLAAGVFVAIYGLRKLAKLIRLAKAEPTNSIEYYTTTHSDIEPPLLRDLRVETWESTRRSAMLSAGVQGRLLKMLVQLSNAKNILEIGCFTGYSALCMAEGLPEDGRITTLDVSERYTSIAKKYWMRAGPSGAKIDLIIGPALDSLKKLEGPFDLVFIDADKESYLQYYNTVLPLVRPGGLILIDNVLQMNAVTSKLMRFVLHSAKSMHKFNTHVATDARVEKVMLPLRDGLTLVRKK